MSKIYRVLISNTSSLESQHLPYMSEIDAQEYCDRLNRAIGPDCVASVSVEDDDCFEEQEDCEHEDMNKGICPECGYDLNEKRISDAYDRAKDRLKYGEW